MEVVASFFFKEFQKFSVCYFFYINNKTSSNDIKKMAVWGLHGNAIIH